MRARVVANAIPTLIVNEHTSFKASCLNVVKDDNDNDDYATDYSYGNDN